jgi:hypothetical protein
MTEQCGDKRLLGSAIVETMATLDKAETDYDSAKAAPIRDEGKIVELAIALSSARLNASEARREYRDHVCEYCSKE